jgi:L-lactate dehydrogenase
LERTPGHFVPSKPVRVVIIGSGLVGSTYGYALLLHDIADEICLIDVNRDKAVGQAMDLNHAMPLLKRTEIWAGDMEDVRDADVVMIAAGVNQKPGETRMDLLRRNAEIVGNVAEEVGKTTRNAIILVATNPVDVMAHVSMVRSGLPPSRVMGSGTALDTARLRYLAGRELGIDPRSVHAFVMGEHGDSEFVAWSRASVAGIDIEDWGGFHEMARDRIESEVRGAAYEVIEKKGATYFAPAMALMRITEAIVKDLRTVMSVSAYLEGEYGIYGVYLGVPAVVGREGILRISETPLSREELGSLQDSGRIVREAVEATRLHEWVTERLKEPVLVASPAFEASSEIWDEDTTTKPRRVLGRRRAMRKPRQL